MLGLQVAFVDRVAVTVGAHDDGVVVEALVEDREGAPVGPAKVQVAIRAVEECELPVDPPERDGVRCVAADDRPDCGQGCGVGEPAGRAEKSTTMASRS